MVPERNDNGELRSLSPDVESALEAAMGEAWEDQAPSPALRRAIRAAAHDARERLLRAEELLVAFKGIEARLIAQRGSALSPSADRHRLIRLLIEAYYSD